jgi:hypothetical protein
MHHVSERRRAIRVDDVRTWPRSAIPTLEAIASHVTKTHQFDLNEAHAVDFWLCCPEAERLGANLVHSLVPRCICCYHASRLLPHEEVHIRTHGLEVSTEELRRRKVTDAQRRYPKLIDTSAAESYLRVSRSSDGSTTGALFVAASQKAFFPATDFYRFVDHWGGEMLRNSAQLDARCAEIALQLDTLSIPTIITVAIEPDAIVPHARLWPPFVSQYLHMRHRAFGVWDLTCSIPADRLIDLVHPDSPSWPSHLQGWRRP